MGAGSGRPRRWQAAVAASAGGAAVAVSMGTGRGRRRRQEGPRWSRTGAGRGRRRRGRATVAFVGGGRRSPSRPPRPTDEGHWAVDEGDTECRPVGDGRRQRAAGVARPTAASGRGDRSTGGTVSVEADRQRSRRKVAGGTESRRSRALPATAERRAPRRLRASRAAPRRAASWRTAAMASNFELCRAGAGEMGSSTFSCLPIFFQFREWTKTGVIFDCLE